MSPLFRSSRPKFMYAWFTSDPSCCDKIVNLTLKHSLLSVSAIWNTNLHCLNGLRCWFEFYLDLPRLASTHAVTMDQINRHEEDESADKIQWETRSISEQLRENQSSAKVLWKNQSTFEGVLQTMRYDSNFWKI